MVDSAGQSYQATIYNVAGCQSFPGTENIAAGDQLEGLDFTLTRGGVITGRVLNGEGKPVIEARLRLVAADEAERRNPQYMLSPFAFQTDDRGIYRVYGLFAGHYLVSVGEGQDEGFIRVGRGSSYIPRTFYGDTTEMAQAKPVLVPIPYRRGEFDTIPARMVLEGLDSSAIRGRPALVGFGSTEIGDRLNTPLHPEFPTPGVEVHAQILDSILTGRKLHPIPLWLTGLILLTTCALAVAAFRSWRGSAAVGVFAGMAAAVYAIGLLTFILGSRVLPAGSMMLAVILAPLLVYAADFVLVERSVNL